MVVDCFSGSGTTAVAASNTGRNFVGCELSKEYYDKNGKYDELSNTDVKTQKLQDFQPLCKPANDAKRQHCTVCKRRGKRFDARTMGYQVGWICGDEDTKVCTGCFWYDIEKFNHEVSKGFVKTA